ncbi:MAG: hypothetical protein KC486_17975 [Myxococcales bacterium]|nr:hypothetical protein [Myxococcales bacterium]
MNDLSAALARALPCLALALTACTAPTATPTETFDALWTDFDELYGGFAIRDIDWDDSYARYRPLVDDGTTDDELFAVLTDMLGETDDGHVHLTAPGRLHWTASRFRRDLVGYDRFDPALVRDGYLGGDFRTDFEDSYTLGTLASGHTYLGLAWVSDQMPILRDVRPLAEASGGLVIDLRHNSGGDFTWALEALSDWRGAPAPAFRSRTRNGPGRGDFTPWFEWSVGGAGPDLGVPIVVLIDRYTISAGERTVLALATFDDVTFIGEPTSGAIATAVGRELVNGWYVSIATQEVLSPDGSTIEGVGYTPDEVVINDPEVMAAGVDEVLERAMELLEQTP